VIRRGALLGLLVAVLAGCVSAIKQPPALGELSGSPAPAAADPTALAAEARELFASRSYPQVEQAAERWTRAADRDPGEIESIVGAVRARIWLADQADDTEVRKQQATMAVQTAQWCDPRAPGSPVCAYWLGAALGVQARERRATALDALKRIVALFEHAAESAPELEHSGPDRALALVYLRAPGWPTGVGDPDLGLEHAERAVAREPDFPPNQLALAEALEAVEDEEQARVAYRTARRQAAELAEDGDPDAAEWVATASKGLERLGA